MLHKFRNECSILKPSVLYLIGILAFVATYGQYESNEDDGYAEPKVLGDKIQVIDGEETQIIDFSTWDNFTDSAGWDQMFERIEVAGITNRYHETQGAAFGDFDHDGEVDILLVNTRSAELWLGQGGFKYQRYTHVSVEGFRDGQTVGYVPTIADFNNDGFFDIYISNSGNAPARFFLSQGRFDVFADVAAQMGVDNEGTYNHGRVAVADLDEDGFLDMGVGANQIGNGRPDGLDRPLRHIYRYTPSGEIYEQGRFEDIATVGAESKVPGFNRNPNPKGKDGCNADLDRTGPTVVFADLDQDGDTDILNGHSNDMWQGDVNHPEAPCATGNWYYGMSVWKNLLAETGQFQFEELLPGGNGIVEVGKMHWDPNQGKYVADLHAFGPLGVNTADVDNDGDLDVLGVTPTDPSWHIQSDMIAGRFWENLNETPGDFRFRIATDDFGLDGLNWTYGQWGEFWDLLEPIPESTAFISWACSEGISVQYNACKDLQTRDYQFMAGGGTVFGDFNNDGFLDLLFMDRHEDPSLFSTIRNVIFMNKGDGTFQPVVTEISGIDINSMSAAARDLNHDGLLDLYFLTSKSNSGNKTGLYQHRDIDWVYWNTGLSEWGGLDNHWVEIYLTGLSYSKLVGTKLYLCEAGTQNILGRRDYFPSGGSYKTSQGLHAHFGLGQTTHVDLHLVLPGVNKTRTKISDIPIDGRIRINVQSGDIERF